MPTSIKPHIKTHHTGIIVMLGVVIGLGIILFYSYPKYKAVQENEALMQQTNQDIARSNQELERLIELNKNPQPTQMEVLLKEQLPPKAMVPDLIRYFEDITPYTTVPDINKRYLKSITVKPAAKSRKEKAMSSYDAFEVQINVESSEESFMEFLEELERADKRLFSIKQINVKADKDPKIAVNEEHKYTLLLTVYSQKQKSAPKQKK